MPRRACIERRALGLLGHVTRTLFCLGSLSGSHSEIRQVVGLGPV
jgi:hypothetical protein